MGGVCEEGETWQPANSKQLFLFSNESSSHPTHAQELKRLTRLAEREHLAPDVLHLAALLLPARRRHDAVRARLVAAVDHVDPRRQRAVAPRRRDVLLDRDLLRRAELRPRGVDALEELVDLVGPLRACRVVVVIGVV